MTEPATRWRSTRSRAGWSATGHATTSPAPWLGASAWRTAGRSRETSGRRSTSPAIEILAPGESASSRDASDGRLFLPPALRRAYPHRLQAADDPRRPQAPCLSWRGTATLHGHADQAFPAHRAGDV